MKTKEELHDDSLDTQEYVYVVFSIHKIHFTVKAIVVCNTIEDAINECVRCSKGLGAEYYAFDYDKVPFFKG